MLIETLCRWATEAHVYWDLPEQAPELVKYRENAVFKPRLGDGGKAALRFHRPGYHSETTLRWLTSGQVASRCRRRSRQRWPAARDAFLANGEKSLLPI